MSKDKPIGLWSAIAIGVGGMVGAGIFSILGIACQMGGNAVYLAFIIGGIIALFNAYSYAKLGAKFPSVGGPTEFLIKGFGRGIVSGGFNILLWIGYIIALSLYARAFASYAMTFFPTAPSIFLNIFATFIILLFVGVDIIGAKAVGKSELFIVIVKVIILLSFAIIGFFFMKPELLSFQKFPGIGNIFFASAIVFIAYEGFGLIINAAGDMDNPQKTLPKALYSSVLIVIGIYVAVSLVVVGNLPLSDIIKAKDYALAEAAKPFLGLVGFKIMAIAALFSTSSAINATLYGGANVSYMIARDRELPKRIDRKMWRYGREGLFITAGLVIILANLFDLSKIAMLGSAAFLIIYTSVNIAHLRLYKETQGNPILIWMAILGNLISLFILIYYLINHSIITLIALAIILTFSFLFEWLYINFSGKKIKMN